jgi:NAD(P) transhydrogenase subunit alpha
MMRVGVVVETFPGELRVALTPKAVRPLKAKGIDVAVERGAGEPAGFADEAYAEEGAAVVAERARVFAESDIVCQLRTYGANPRQGAPDLDLMRPGQTIIGFCEPLTSAGPIEAMAARGVRTFAVELIPRTTRAQSMDALSSQAMVAGYKAALLAAATLGRLFPMMITAAGSVPAAHVLVIGAGVAGLQAIATCKRLGAVVSAYDVRPAVKEEVESVGATFLQIDLATGQGEGRGGYAQAMDDTFYKAQRDLMAAALAKSDVVITTAAIPGKKSPVLVTADMVARMPRGAVIVDLAAERGGNCELTRADDTVVAGGVTILGPTNLAATVPAHASQFYSKNLVAFLLHVVKDGAVRPATGDEIMEHTLLTEGGRIVQQRVRAILGLDAHAEGSAA